MKKRNSVQLPASTMTLQEAEEQMGIYAKADAKISKINAQMDIEIAKIREKHAEELSKLSEEKTASMQQLMLYCTQNKDKFQEKRSIELAHGKMGFRTGTPALKNLKGFTWAACLELAKEKYPQYVRTKEELAKDALLVDRETPEAEEIFNAIKVQVVQEESWFVELKKEEIAEPVL